MKDFRYLAGVTTLKLDRESCIGCGMCEIVCPHGVFMVEKKKAITSDVDGCMECGACAMNCPVMAIQVTPGVGCAMAIINSWFRKDGAVCCG